MSTSEVVAETTPIEKMARSAGERQEVSLGEWRGVLLAIVSSCLGGTAAAVTRYLVGNADPLTLAILRWGIGLLCVLPIALALRVRWPRRMLCRSSHLPRLALSRSTADGNFSSMII